MSSLRTVARRMLRQLDTRVPPVARALREMRRALSGPRADRFAGRSTEQIFDAFYREHLWNSEESVSGIGSTLAGTAGLRAALPGLFRELGARSVLDAPCGDFNWMRKVDWDLDAYIGGDIVADLVERLRREHGDAKRSFVKLDITSDPLPVADVFFCRDCFIHLTNEQVLAALRNAARSSCRYLMTNTFPRIETNRDSTTGAVRRLNLQRPPFDLPEPVRLVEDRLDEPGVKYLGVWSREQLAHLLQAPRRP